MARGNFGDGEHAIVTVRIFHGWSTRKSARLNRSGAEEQHGHKNCNKFSSKNCNEISFSIHVFGGAQTPVHHVGATEGKLAEGKTSGCCNRYRM